MRGHELTVTQNPKMGMDAKCSCRKWWLEGMGEDVIEATYLIHVLEDLAKRVAELELEVQAR